MLRWSGRLKSAATSLSEWQSYADERKHLARFKASSCFGTSNVQLQEEIVKLLQLGDRTGASTLLVNLTSSVQGLQARDFISILQFCARKPDPLLAMTTCNAMGENGVELDGKCFFLACQALCKGGNVKEAFHLLSTIQVENLEIQPRLAVYNNLLEACIQMNRLSLANDCLHLMEQHGVGKNATTYGLLLKLSVLQEDLQAARRIWQKYINFYGLSFLPLRKFVKSFAILKDLESAYSALQQMVGLCLQQGLYSDKYADSKLVDLRLDIPIPFHDELSQNRYFKDSSTSVDSEYHPEAEWSCGVKSTIDLESAKSDVTYPSISQRIAGLLRSSYNDVMHVCAHSHNDVLAERLLLQMENLGLKPSPGTYDGLIRAFVSVRSSYHDGINALNIMEQKNMKPRNSTLAALSVSCSRACELVMAETFLVRISRTHHTYPFNAFLEACETMDKPEKAVKVLAKMKELGVNPDIRTYELLFSLFANVNAPYEDGNLLSQVAATKRIKAIEMDMIRHGIQHSSRSMKNLLNAFGSEGMILEMIQRLRAAENQFFYRNTHLDAEVYNTVLHSLIEALECGIAIEVFKSMISYGISPNDTTYGIMMDCCSAVRCFRSARAVLSLMTRHGYPLNLTTLTGLVKTQLQSEDSEEEALKLVDRAKMEGIKPDVILYNTIIQAARRKGRIDVIEMIIERMHREKIQPDPSTCSQVFFAYVNDGFFSTSLEALQVLCMRMISEDDDTLQAYKAEYEELIMDEDMNPESLIVGIFDESPYLVAALLYLRWCATLVHHPVPVSWTLSESPWAKRLSADYGCRWQSE